MNESQRRVLQCVLVAVVFLAAAFFIYERAVFADSQKRARLAEFTAAIADSLDKKIILSLSGNRSDTVKPSYKLLKIQLSEAKNHLPDIKFLYLMGMDEKGGVFFFADS